MSKKIKIHPSGREFTSEGNSTLLEAGLRAGLALDYGCSNGNCGLCLARIISGEVKKVGFHDYSVCEDKKLSGHVLMCCHTATTDLILEAPEARNSTEIQRQQITARVKSVNITNNDVALVHLKTPRTNRLRFLAGQYVRLGFSHLPTSQQYLASCPCDDMNLHFHIARLPNKPFSEYVFNQLKKGDTLEINGPTGDFVLDEDTRRSLVFIAWDTGFAPVRSLIEHAMALELAQDIHLLWITDNKQSRYQDNLCRSWQDAFDNFFYHPVDVATGREAIDGEFISGLLNLHPDEISNHEFYIAGSRQQVDAFDHDVRESALIVRRALVN